MCPHGYVSINVHSQIANKGRGHDIICAKSSSQYVVQETVNVNCAAVRTATCGSCSRRCKLPHVCFLVVSAGNLEEDRYERASETFSSISSIVSNFRITTTTYQCYESLLVCNCGLPPTKSLPNRAMPLPHFLPQRFCP